MANESRIDDAWLNYCITFRDNKECLVSSGAELSASRAEASQTTKRRLDLALFDYLAEFDYDQRERFGEEVSAPLADYAKVSNDHHAHTGAAVGWPSGDRGKPA